MSHHLSMCFKSDEPQKLFQSLEQKDFSGLEHAASLKGLLKPFKGKGELEVWASRCEGLRERLIHLAQHQIIRQTQGYPFSVLPVQLALQTTGAGTAFLRWRKPDRSAMGVALWETMMVSPSVSPDFATDLLQIELQRITLNMQISLMHTLARQAIECAVKAVHAQEIYQTRMKSL